MSKLNIPELVVEQSYLQFIFPFQIRESRSGDLIHQLNKEKWEFFDLRDTSQEDKFYGDIRISHERMEKFFLPNMEPILFPQKTNEKNAFRRFSKIINQKGYLQSQYLKADFQLVSFDIFVCPYNIGIMNLRVNLPENMSYDDVLHFIDVFRQLDKPDGTTITINGKEYSETKGLIFKEYCPWLEDHLSKKKNTTYFGSLPFFIEERMQVYYYLAFEKNTVLDEITLYRAAAIKGYDSEGNPYAGAKSEAYIHRFCSKHVYDRWGDESYYIISNYAFVCVSNESEEKSRFIAERMYGENYYTNILFFFNRLLLLQLSYENSQLRVEDKKGSIEKLIIRITNFSAQFYQPEVHSRIFGKEIYMKMKEIFHMDELYIHVNQTLGNLYKNHEKLTGKRHEYLLSFLTTYTVISGIYGMNLVIEQDWKGSINWSHAASYSIFEYIALFVALSGIILGGVLGIQTVYKWIKEKIKSKED
jgi:hypothetical protein